LQLPGGSSYLSTVKLQRRRTEVSLRVLFPGEPFFSRINRTEIEKKIPFIYYKYFLKYTHAFGAALPVLETSNKR